MGVRKLILGVQYINFETDLLPDINVAIYLFYYYIDLNPALQCSMLFFNKLNNMGLKNEQQLFILNFLYYWFTNQVTDGALQHPLEPIPDNNLLAKTINVLTNEKRRLENIVGKKTSNNPIEDNNSLPTTFKEIFTIDDWQLYINTLTELEKPILKKEGDKWRIGYRTIGALCNYFGDLLHEGIIKGTRQEICNVIYREIGLKAKPDISSLTKMNNAYHRPNGYKTKLKRNKNLFPKGEFGKI